ncbi:unnamed protein product, partial [Hydatigera taeniaeformis]|uniref:Uncharacterized protein n=1 Tax=Hydatigena taeniaeformis TaxID=6205 RepID=A0A0R3WYH5_HYDTA
MEGVARCIVKWSVAPLLVDAQRGALLTLEGEERVHRREVMHHCARLSQLARDDVDLVAATLHDNRRWQWVVHEDDIDVHEQAARCLLLHTVSRCPPSQHRWMEMFGLVGDTSLQANVTSSVTTSVHCLGVGGGGDSDGVVVRVLCVCCCNPLNFHPMGKREKSSKCRIFLPGEVCGFEADGLALHLAELEAVVRGRCGSHEGAVADAVEKASSRDCVHLSLLVRAGVSVAVEVYCHRVLMMESRD